MTDLRLLRWCIYVVAFRWWLITTIIINIINTAVQAQPCPGTLTCKYITSSATATPPKLDGDFSDWASVTGGISTPAFTYFGTQYEAGNGNYKCVYDSTKIYFAMEWPGKYRFNASDDHQSPAIGTMTKIGSKAGFINMGGCPEGSGVCDNSVPFPTSCESYIVDLGAHWETSRTKQGVEYPIGSSSSSNSGTGRDAVSGKDDEYAVGPQCRRPDDGTNAGNEWAGAWTHTKNSTIGALGYYRFELSRLLSTPSTRTDAQFVPGNTYSFGIAFWDPFESETSGWTNAGHYLTGCGFQWITLVLASPPPVPSPTISSPVLVAVPPITKPPTKKPVVVPTASPTQKPVKVPPPTKPPTSTKPVMMVSPTKPPTTAITNKPSTITSPRPSKKPVVSPTTTTPRPPSSPRPRPTSKPVVTTTPTTIKDPPSIPVIGVPITSTTAKPTALLMAPYLQPIIPPKRKRGTRTRKPRGKFLTK